MRAAPVVSIIIPVYNVERYLRRCLDSVLAQTLTDWEAVCVNDGSPDGSAAILEEYTARDTRFRIVTKTNGGLSDARNAGMAVARGEYLVFLDSDDMIHPQTLEIAVTLARRDGSDIVSWYKDPLFRPRLLVRHFLGMDIDHVVPRRRMRKRYDPTKVESHVTDDVFAHVAEGSTKGIDHPIKHFYVWRFLLRRELVGEVKFLKGVIFEDFPWWSEVLLLHPRVTITDLPFYYYFPNFHSIDLSHKRADKVGNWIAGLRHTWQIYSDRASEYEMRMWQQRCMWPVIECHIIHPIVDELGPDSPEAAPLIKQLEELWDRGVFDSPFDAESRKYRDKTEALVGRSVSTTNS